MSRKDITTARKGNPGDASRGAAVSRAKLELQDLLDAWLSIDREAMELDRLAELIGGDRHSARQRLAVATLDEINTWKSAAERKLVDRSEGVAA